MQGRYMAAVMLGLLTVTGPAMAQKKASRKAPAKPAATAGVKGTAQLPGDNGKLGQAYTMGVELPLNFSLRSATYTLDRLNIAGASHVPSHEQKLLLLKFTVQNPNKADTQIRFDTFTITAVDSKDVNYVWIGDIVKEGEDQQSLDQALKPGQKVEVVGGILVPAKAAIPKLMVQHRSGGKVLRFDTHGLIKPLSAAFADAADTTGLTARDEIPAEKDAFCALQNLDVKLQAAAIVTDKLGDIEPTDGHKLLVVTLTLRNGTYARQPLRFDTLQPQLTSADGEKESLGENRVFKAARDEDVDMELAPGESCTCRLILRIPKDSKPARLGLSQGESHRYTFDISSAN